MEDFTEYSPHALVAICSNLQKACEKQMRATEAGLWKELVTHFTHVATEANSPSLEEVTPYLVDDIENSYPKIALLAEAAEDRGALRCVTWGKKVTAIQKSILARYEKQGEALFEGKGLYVCEACGFIAISKEIPDLCPICKAPASRFIKIS